MLEKEEMELIVSALKDVLGIGTTLQSMVEDNNSTQVDRLNWEVAILCYEDLEPKLEKIRKMIEQKERKYQQ